MRCREDDEIATPEHRESQAVAEVAGRVPLGLPIPLRARPKHLASVSDTTCVVHVARTAAEVENLREEWTRLGGDGVQTDIDHFLWALDAEPQVVRPHVLAIRREGRLEAIVAARISDIPLRCRLGPATLYSPRIRAICVLRNGVLGLLDAEIARVVVDELSTAIAGREADAIVFRQLERGSLLDDAVRASSTFATRQHLAPTDLRWQIDLPPTFEAYVGSLSASTRKGMRRTAKRIDEELGGNVAVRVFRDPDEAAAFLDDAESVAARTYQRGLSVGFDGNGAQRARNEMLFERGWFRGYTLSVDGKPVAFEGGEVYGGRFHSLSAGYDPDFAGYRVGAHLLHTAIEELVTDPAVTVFDFGYGDAGYKRKLGSRPLEEGDVVVYARRPRPLWINAARTTIFGASEATRWVLGRLGLLEPLQARMRRRASARAGS